MALHFVGFRDTGTFYRAVRVFGRPDFIHRHWDVRAKFGGEWAPGDVRVFATGTDQDAPSQYSFDDSQHM
jgi:hypothetical protein